jgi:hypothetical protein
MKKSMMIVPVMTILLLQKAPRAISFNVQGGKKDVSASRDSVPKNKMPYPLPATITFDWEVIQERGGEEETGLFTYYFTTNGDYAGMRPDKKDERNSLVIYDKGGAMLMFDENKKTITIMKLIKPLAEGAQLGKVVAEKINKKPLKKDTEEDMTITKSGKTKSICGFTADEYLIKSEGGTFSAWYANVSFDPVKIYTMGVGRPADISKLKNNPEMKNNMAAIPVINKNYLWAEMEAAGKKGLQTKSITKKTVSISTAGYRVIDFSNKGLKDMIRGKED